MSKEKKKPAKEKVEETIEKKPAKEKPKGVLFWGRIRVDTNAGPMVYDDPGEVPKGQPYNQLQAEFVKIEYPRGSGKSLKIFGAKRIDDKHIVAHLVLLNKPVRKAGLGKGSKAGVLLYDPDEVVEQGYMTREELEDAAVRNVPPKWYRPPTEPTPDFNMFPDPELDRWAMKNNVPKYDTSAKRWDKILALKNHCAGR